MIIQEAPDQSTQLALSLSKALTGGKKESLAALLHPKMSKTKVKQIMAAMDKGKTIAFDLVEMLGKVKVARYECVIDFTKNEVHVIMKNNKHEYAVHDFKEIG